VGGLIVADGCSGKGKKTQDKPEARKNYYRQKYPDYQFNLVSLESSNNCTPLQFEHYYNASFFWADTFYPSGKSNMDERGTCLGK